MLRAYNKEDIEAIVKLEEELLGVTLGFSFYESDLTNRYARHYVLEEDNEVIGFLSSIFDGNSLEILNFGISLSHQGKGKGIGLLTEVFDLLLCEGLNDVILEVRASNVKAIGLYNKLNFKVISTRKKYYSNGEDAYVMQKLYDTSKDIINLEADIFSLKNGLRYESDFIERYALNYYDLIDDRELKLEFNELGYINVISNWYDSSYFAGFEVSYTGLMHVNAYNYQSISRIDYEITDDFNLEEYHNYIYVNNNAYGKGYALKYADYRLKALKDGKSKSFVCYLDSRIVGGVNILESYNGILIYDLFVLEEYRNRGIASSIMDKVIEYAKNINKQEIYLEVDLEESPQEMYKKMNFKIIDEIYEMFLSK